MTIRFGDIIEQLRMRVIKDIEYILVNSQTSVQSDKAILYYFYMLRQNNNKLYKNIIGLIASDHYKMIKEYSILDKSIDEDELFINLYESLSSQDELIAIIEEEPAIIISILSYMNEFECYDYFEKRQCYLNNKSNLDTLFKLSPCSVLDYLYYCQKYDMNTLKIIYDEQVETYDYNDTTIDAKDAAIYTIISTLEILFETDIDNYKDLMSELLANYYMIGKKQMQSNKKIVKKEYLAKNLRLIENSDIIDVLNRLKQKDCKFLIEVLRRNINNYDENISINLDNEREQKTLKKINDIKNFNIIE